MSSNFASTTSQIYGRNHRLLRLSEIYVHPPERRKGIGSAVLREIETVARLLKFEAVLVRYVHNPARAALLRRGYRVIETGDWADLLKYVV
jgi:ribosomal protein S18 acetylase RimI-like enzyme